MIKRILDVTLSAMLLIVLAPVLLIIVILTKIFLGGPVLFVQQRPGLDCIPFKMVKFRTMRDTRGADSELLSDAERLTRYGRFLRSTSLDEIPGLWNVLKGDISLVGPRPLMMEYVPLYTAEQNRRHAVRPGITGWAQVNGRNTMSWEEKFAADIWYVDNRTLWLDIRILWLTLAKVLSREGIEAEGSATMPAFTGSKPTNSGDRPKKI
jgi:lipopolysaccharide/colanic/teichoic acid biosynthesis glycosyltransferase